MTQDKNPATFGKGKLINFYLAICVVPALYLFSSLLKIVNNG